MLLFLQAAQHAIHGDLVVKLIHLNAHFGDDTAVDSHAAIGDHLFRGAAGSNAGEGKIFLKTHHEMFQPF